MTDTTAAPESAPSTQNSWPPLPYADWQPTKETLHRYAQIIGKIRMSLVPFRNHWWHVTLLPTTRGLTTGPMPQGGRAVEIVLDFIDHRVHITSSDGQHRTLALGQRPACADFYRDVFAALDELGFRVAIHPAPFDLGDDLSLADDTIHDSYDADAVARYWRILASTHQVLEVFAARFNGKASPIQLFWHGFDLAHSRYSGRRAPARPGADAVTVEAYSHEVIAFGFWPGRLPAYAVSGVLLLHRPRARRAGRAAAGPAAAQWVDTGSGTSRCLPTTRCGPHRTRSGRCSPSMRAPTAQAPAARAGTGPGSRRGWRRGSEPRAPVRLSAAPLPAP
jgi:hypothetical protein